MMQKLRNGVEGSKNKSKSLLYALATLKDISMRKENKDLKLFKNCLQR